MNNFLNAQYSWRNFFVLTILLLALYLLLGALNRILPQVRFLGRVQAPIHTIINRLYRLSLPLILIYLSTVFILVKPKLHGIIALLTVIGAYRHVRSYLSGVLLRFQQKLAMGKSIETGSLHGVIGNLGLFGLQINTSTGVHFQAYDELVKNGYTIAGGEQISRLLWLNMSPIGEMATAKINHQKNLFHLFSASPFLDKSHRPEVSKPNLELPQFSAQVLLKEEKHLTDLVQVINEWGYACEVKN